MQLLQKLKALLGFDGGGRGRSEPEVTVERRPSTETEDAVKGTDDGPRAPRSAGSGGAGETTTDADREAPDTDETATSPEAAEDVESITGIGPTYAERLAGVGIETVADLAEADPEAVATAAETSQSRARDWVDQARDR